MLFVETHYTLATEEAERIGVDHVARLSNTGTIDGSTGTCIHDQLVKFRLLITRHHPCTQELKVQLFKDCYVFGRF